MNYQEPYKISNINLDNLVYQKYKLYNNKKIILIKYNDQNKLKKLVFQTPTILNLYEPSFYDNYSEIELALHGKENNKVDYFTDFLKKLENKIKHDATFYSNEWFSFNEEKSLINFQKIIRESDNFTNGTLKLKILKNNDFETLLQINNSKKINISDIKINTWCKMLLECYAVWINANNDFGIYLRPILISFSIQDYNYNLIQDSEDEEDYNIPDTEINNIFLKNNKIENTNSNCTSQLEINELINKLESSEFNIQNKINNNIEQNINIEQNNTYEVDSNITSSNNEFDLDTNKNNNLNNTQLNLNNFSTSSDSDTNI